MGWEWMENFPRFNDGYPVKEIPKASGLYLIGSTHFDPILNKQYFWIKVGMSTNLRSRMRGYRSQNPMIFIVDFRCFNEEAVGDEEMYCQEKLSESAIALAPNTWEWFLTDKETYMRICDQGFNYFY